MPKSFLLRSIRSVAFATALLPTVALPCAAFAQSGGGASAASPAKHPLVIYTEGQKSSDATDLVTSTLPETAALDANDAFKKAAQKRGQKFPLGITLTLESKRQAMLSKLGAAATDVGLEVVILGVVRPSKPSGREVLLLVLEAGKDSPSVEKVIKLGAPNSKEETQAALKELYDSWAPPVVATTTETPTDKPAEEKPKEEEGADFVRPPNVYGHEIFQGFVGFDLAGRFFNYNDEVSNNLRAYDVFGAPGIAVNLSVYPLAPTGIVFLRDLGLTGDFRIALGLSSATADGSEVGTMWQRFGGGLRYRLPLGPTEAPYVLGFRGGFYQDAFTIDETAELVGESPTTEYNFMRGGLDLRLPLGPVAITAFGNYNGALATGAVGDRFKDTKIGGIDVGGGLTVPIISGLEARLQAEYVRWFYAFGPVPGDSYVAGGALDENVHIEIGPQYVY
jgi:hypothetical protein